MTLLTVSVGVGYAAISNGASAIDVIGQYDDDLDNPQPVFTKGTANNGPNKLGMQLDGGSGTIILDATNHRLFVSDTMNNRVLVYSLNNDDTLPDRIPDFVLGQSVFYTNDAATTSSGLRRPSSLAFNSGSNLLFVSDTVNNRILVFDVASVTSGEAAVNVIGQSSFTASDAATTASGLNAVSSLFYDGTNDRLFASDAGNNRVLVFTGSSLSNGMDANVVLGQANFTSATAATTQAGLSRPSGIAASGSTILVVDSGNNRILTYTGSSLATGMNANKVIGQTSFTVATAGTTQSKLSRPAGIVYAAPNLYIADAANNRVLVFTGSAIATGMNANKVLGQTLYTTASPANTQAGMNGPATLGYDAVNNLLFVGQNRNHRVSIFDVTSITNGEDAVDLLGQYDDSSTDPQPVYTKSAANNGSNKFGLNITNGNIPQNMAIDSNHNRLFVADAVNNRVLVYGLDSSHFLSDQTPDFVLGQPNFYTNTAHTTQSGFSLPVGVAYDTGSDRLFVLELTNNRVLVFSGASISTGMTANTVIGQSSFTVGTAGTTQSKFAGPTGIAYSNATNRLFIVDRVANRILVFSGASISTGMNAAKVLGQSLFTTNTSATTATGLSLPYGVTVDDTGNRLFVTDRNNHRVLVYDITTIDDGEAAIHVLGQSLFTTNSTSITAAGFNLPRGLAFDSTNNRLFVADLSNSRVEIFSTDTITDGEDAIYVLGQPDFTTTLPFTVPTAINMSNPAGLLFVPTTNQLYVADAGGVNRITIFDVAPEVLSSSSSSIAPTTNDNGGGGGRRGSPGRGGVAPRIDGHTIVSPAVSSSSSSIYQTTNTESSTSSSIFRDVPPRSWFSTAVEEVVTRKIFSGYADAQGNPLGDFGPADPVTVGQMLKIALLSSGHKLPSSLPLPRNPSATDWSAPYVALAESLPLTLATSDVHQNATRGEVISTLLEAFGIGFEKDLPNEFTDLDMSHPNAAAIITAAKLGIVTGDTNASGTPLHTVRPDDQINRAEVAVLVVRMLEMVGR